MQPYKALWRINLPGHGTAYREVTVVTAPQRGHVKLENKMAVPVSELVGVDGDGYAVVTPGGKRWMDTSEAGRALRSIGNA